nr:putative uncharacterized protein DDB_G0271982 [Procambarus clarkii]
MATQLEEKRDEEGRGERTSEERGERTSEERGERTSEERESELQKEGESELQKEGESELQKEGRANFRRGERTSEGRGERTSEGRGEQTSEGRESELQKERESELQKERESELQKEGESELQKEGESELQKGRELTSAGGHLQKVYGSEDGERKRVDQKVNIPQLESNHESEKGDLEVDVTSTPTPEAHTGRVTSGEYGTLVNIRTSFKTRNHDYFNAICTAFVKPAEGTRPHKPGRQKKQVVSKWNVLREAVLSQLERSSTIHSFLDRFNKEFERQNC